MPTVTPVQVPEDAQLGYGTTVGYRVAGSTTAYLPLATLVNVEGPGNTVGEVETTRISDVVKKYKPTRPDREVTLNLQHVSTDKGCQDMQAATAKAPVPSFDFLVTYPDGETDQFIGFPKGYTKSGVEGEAVIMAAVPLRVNSLITTTPPPIAS